MLSHDPMHLAMTYAHAHQRKRAPVSRVLCVLLMKFARTDDDRNTRSCRPVYEGNEEGLVEILMLRHSMPLPVATDILSRVGLAPALGYHQGARSCRHLLWRTESTNTPSHHRGVSLGRLVWSAVQLGRLQWLLNNLRPSTPCRCRSGR